MVFESLKKLIVEDIIEKRDKQGADIDTSEIMITSETDLVKDYGVDSLSIISMILKIEEIFDIEFDMDELEIDSIGKVSELTKIIESKHMKEL